MRNERVFDRDHWEIVRIISAVFDPIGIFDTGDPKQSAPHVPLFRVQRTSVSWIRSNPRTR